MAVSPERFAQGLTYDQFKGQMTRNQTRFAENESRVQLSPADVATFKNLPQPLKVVAIAEDWCGEVIDNLPILGRLAQESGKLDLRVFLRDQNLDLIDQYLNRGQFRSIPVFVFFDQGFNELGRFTERPERVTQRRDEKRKEIYAKNPDFGSPETPVDQLPEDARARLQAALQQMRGELKPTENQDVIQDLTAIARKAAG